MATLFDGLVPETLSPIKEGQPKDGVYQFELPMGQRICVRAFHDANLRDRHQYVVFIVRVVFTGQQQFVAVQQSHTQARLGFIFPIASLAEDSRFDGEWPANYARMAVEMLLNSDIAWGVVRSMTLDELVGRGPMSLGEMFDDNLGVVVLGKSNLEAAQCSDSVVRMMIQEHGIRACEPYTSTGRTQENRIFQETVRVRQCSADLSSSVNTISELLKVAETLNHLPSRFLVQYQIVESLIARIYEHCVVGLIGRASQSQDVWKVREEFDRISSEKARVNRLFNECVSGAPEDLSALRRDMKDACVAFLRKADPTVRDAVNLLPLHPVATGRVGNSNLGNETQAGALLVVEGGDSCTASVGSEVPSGAARGEGAVDAGRENCRSSGGVNSVPVADGLTGKEWPDLLYKCRNLIVHRQWQIEAVPEKELESLCLSFEQVLFRVISCFSLQSLLDDQE